LAVSGAGTTPATQTIDIQRTDTAVVFIDPQNDVLSEKGANWATVGASLTENRTVEKMERIFKAAKANGYEATRPDKRAAAGVSTSRSTRSARRAPLWFALGGPALQGEDVRFVPDSLLEGARVRTLGPR
jgi:hypothetical protein